MARLDATAIWFQRGEDVEAMAETAVAGEERRRLPTLAWVIGAVVLTAAIFAAVLIHITHAARIVDEPLPLAIPAAAATAPAAAPTTQPAPATQATATAQLTSATAQPTSATAQPTSATAQPTSATAEQPAPAARTAQAAPAPTAAAKINRSADGERLLRHGRPAAALALFQHALAQNPDDARAQRGACVALGRLGRAKERARLCAHRSRG